MRATRPPLAVGLALLLAGYVLAQPKPQEAILGKWVMSQKEKEGEVKVTVEFLKDNKYKGDASFTVGGKTDTETFEGTYKFLDDKNLEVTTKQGGKDETKKLALKTLTDKELVLTDDASKKELKFTRPAK